jgi:hypothetical protein
MVPQREIIEIGGAAIARPFAHCDARLLPAAFGGVMPASMPGELGSSTKK